MARLSRIVIPGTAHHVIQRGNRRQNVFFREYDRSSYLNYLVLYAMPEGLKFLGYCLMDNNVHLNSGDTRIPPRSKIPKIR